MTDTPIAPLAGAAAPSHHAPWRRAVLSLRRRAWSAGALWRVALTLPLMAWKVHAAIYWQALLLWVKRTPFHPHPGPARVAEPHRRAS